MILNKVRWAWNPSISWTINFGIFEILNNYGTSWKINILESPSTYRLPPLHADSQHVMVGEFSVKASVSNLESSAHVI